MGSGVGDTGSSMTIEKMAEHELAALYHGVATAGTGQKASRIIDALTAENERLRSILAEATALLRLTYPDTDATETQWCDRRDAFLANQPAAPARTPEIRPGCTRADYYEPATPAHTEAEQAVLDTAMQWHRLDTSANAKALHHYCAALARRGV